VIIVFVFECLGSIDTENVQRTIRDFAQKRFGSRLNEMDQLAILAKQTVADNRQEILGVVFGFE
jgi:hypothetical protein